MSERGLVYTNEDLHHRMLVLYEANAIATGRGAYLLRTLLSEGVLRYEVVERTREGCKTRLIEREGPTGLIVTTTETGLDPELETRLMSLTVTDTAAQTKAVMQALARSRSSSDAVAVDYARWHNFQQWLTAGERRVVVPFAEKLAELVLAIAVRQRRDFGALLTLICSHALLHHASRDRDRTGAIVATTVDYAAVRELVADVFAEGIEAMVSTTVRETVDAISALNKHEVSLRELAAKLTLDKSAASRRLRQATELGYLVNRETRSGRPARIALGDALPVEVQVLPAPDQLAASPAEMRAVARRGEWRGSTGGQCAAYQQANLVILPKEAAVEFAASAPATPSPARSSRSHLRATRSPPVRPRALTSAPTYRATASIAGASWSTSGAKSATSGATISSPSCSVAA